MHAFSTTENGLIGTMERCAELTIPLLCFAVLQLWPRKRGGMRNTKIRERFHLDQFYFKYPYLNTSTWQKG